jgi:hypothetical protein
MRKQNTKREMSYECKEEKKFFEWPLSLSESKEAGKVGADMGRGTLGTACGDLMSWLVDPPISHGF